MGTKQFKCGYGHCAHKNKIVYEPESVKINTRRWHKDCYELQGLIAEIEEDYIQHVSKSVPIVYLRKVINEIVFGEKLENANIEKWESNLNAGRYLSFCLKFAIANKIPLTHPPGMYYLIDNARIKKAYQKENELRIQKEIKEEMKHEENTASAPVSVPVSVQVKATTQKGNTIGFGSILKGGK